MDIPLNITLPLYPRFLPTPDQGARELYITCTQPLALLWVRQTVPAQIYILNGPDDEQLLKDAAEWYKEFALRDQKN